MDKYLYSSIQSPLHTAIPRVVKLALVLLYVTLWGPSSLDFHSDFISLHLHHQYISLALPFIIAGFCYLSSSLNLKLIVPSTISDCILSTYSYTIHVTLTPHQRKDFLTAENYYRKSQPDKYVENLIMGCHFH